MRRVGYFTKQKIYFIFETLNTLLWIIQVSIPGPEFMQVALSEGKKELSIKSRDLRDSRHIWLYCIFSVVGLLDNLSL